MKRPTTILYLQSLLLTYLHTYLLTGYKTQEFKQGWTEVKVEIIMWKSSKSNNVNLSTCLLEIFSLRKLELIMK